MVELMSYESGLSLRCSRIEYCITGDWVWQVKNFMAKELSSVADSKPDVGVHFHVLMLVRPHGSSLHNTVPMCTAELLSSEAARLDSSGA